MQEISNSVRQRLGARPQPQAHPDPDILTAYIEQVLPAGERQRVIEHLADCRDCREVVSLSLPQLEPQPLMAQVAARPRWWMSGFRWATVAATVAIAATLIVERPWQRFASAPSSQQENMAATPNVVPLSGGTTNQSVPSAATTPSMPKASTPQTPTSSASRSGETSRAAGAGTGSAGRFPEARPRQAPSRSGFVAGGIQESDRFVSAAGALSPIVTAAQPTTTVTADRETKDLSANDQALRKRAVSPNAADGERGNVAVNGLSGKQDAANARAERSASDGALPVAPEPSTGRQDLRRFTPPLSASNTQNAAAIEVTPPTTSSPQPPPSADDNTLPKTNFAKKVTTKVGEGVKGAVKTVMDVASPAKPPSGAQSFASAPAAVASNKKSETHNVLRHALPQKPQWTIGPRGELLVKSDAVSQWHEAYTQSPDIQFRVVVTHGSQVWAGGNNATLIHSWNGGVNWETLKVPDSGDITSISIDDDLQVKTSNGQTFVSTDHGQTWVPLQQPK